MWKSPIDIFRTEIETKLTDDVLTAVSKYGVNVDAEELTKLLRGDRESYEHGYDDGYDDGFNENNWEHVSVSPYKGKLPTWDDMCEIKDIFWDDEEVVIQIHPKKSEYVNILDNCLHLWRHREIELPR